MLTLALQTTDASLWGDVEQWFTAPEVHILPWGRLYTDLRPAVDAVLQRAIALVQAHPDVKMLLDSSLSLESSSSSNTPQAASAQSPLPQAATTAALAITEQALNTPMVQTLRLVITQQVFWQLGHAGRYDLRLVAQLAPPHQPPHPHQTPSPQTPERISLFEVFSGEPPAQRLKKQETKTQFEQALFLYFLGFHAEAACLFADCLTFNPQDAVAAHYVECCHSASIVTG